MQSLARYRSERAQPRATAAVDAEAVAAGDVADGGIAFGGYRGHAMLLERWVGVVLWLALIAVLVVESG
ncbi:MAG: hypothetical protein L6Q99_18575 [Planctomycetes bacterium]|nr:hypothetical protein [Planctomycetota bacterium]